MRAQGQDKHSSKQSSDSKHPWWVSDPLRCCQAYYRRCSVWSQRGQINTPDVETFLWQAAVAGVLTAQRAHPAVAHSAQLLASSSTFPCRQLWHRLRVDLTLFPLRSVMKSSLILLAEESGWLQSDAVSQRWVQCWKSDYTGTNLPQRETDDSFLWRYRSRNWQQPRAQQVKLISKFIHSSDGGTL